MIKTKTLEEVRLMIFDDIYNKWQAKRLTGEEAAQILAKEDYLRTEINKQE